MSGDGDNFDDRLKRGSGRALATSALRRLGKTAAIAARTGWSALGRGGSSVFAAADKQAVEQAVLSLGELKGIAMKMGQILSYIDDSLPPETQALLAKLQTTSPETPWSEVEATIMADLDEDRAAELLLAIDHVPVAAASVGQVHRASVPAVGDLAVKVRHPGIDEAMRADFRAALPSAFLGRLLAPGADLKEMMQEVKEGFLSECDYTREAHWQGRFGELFADHRTLKIPRVHHEFSGARVLTSEWCDGLTLDQWLAGDPQPAMRSDVSRALYEFYVGSLYRHGAFNADPHPGNLLLRKDGTTVVLDHGCVREFPRETVAHLAMMSRGVRGNDRTQVLAALTGLGAKVPKSDAAYDTTLDMLRGFYGPIMKKGRHRLEASNPLAMGSVFEAKKKMLRMHIPGKLLFLFRIRFGLYAVLSKIGAEVDWAALEDDLLAEAG